MISWMEGFRHAYELPKIWGLVKERLVAFSLVILAGIPLCFSTMLVAFGTASRPGSCFIWNHEFGLFILLMWTCDPLADCQSHQHRGDRPDLSQCRPADPTLAQRATGSDSGYGLWFLSTALFGWYLQRYADYSILYGSLGVGIALLVWMYMISLVILVGAEFNAMLSQAFLARQIGNCS